MAEFENEFTTQTGCTLMLNSHWSYRPNVGLDGRTVLSLRMKQAGDGREVEVLLTPEERMKLVSILTSDVWQTTDEVWDG